MQLLLTAVEDKPLALVPYDLHEASRRKIEMIFVSHRNAAIYRESSAKIDFTNPVFHPNSNTRLVDHKLELLAYDVDPATGLRREVDGHHVAHVWNHFSLDARVEVRRAGRKQTAARMLVPEDAILEREIVIVKDGVQYTTKVARGLDSFKPKASGSSAGSWGSAGKYSMTRSERKEMRGVKPKAVRAINNEIAAKDVKVSALKLELARLREELVKLKG